MLRAGLNRSHLVEWAVGIGGQRYERRFCKPCERHKQFMQRVAALELASQA
jgi:hypothetical protein